MEMQSGKQVLEVISKLRSMDKQWEVFALETQEEIPEEVHMQLGRLFQLLREELKIKEAGQVEAELIEAQVSKELVQKLMEETKKSLRFYFNLAPLRKLEERDKTALQGLLATIYQKYIVRLERGYLRQIPLEECTSEELYEIARCMDSLTDFYVSRSYTRQGMIRDLLDETGLSQDTCGCWAELIEQNYLLLKLNLIVLELESIKKEMKKE